MLHKEKEKKRQSYSQQETHEGVVKAQTDRKTVNACGKNRLNI